MKIVNHSHSDQALYSGSEKSYFLTYFGAGTFLVFQCDRALDIVIFYKGASLNDIILFRVEPDHHTFISGRQLSGKYSNAGNSSIKNFLPYGKQLINISLTVTVLLEYIGLILCANIILGTYNSVDFMPNALPSSKLN